jgi:hypothetical protein
LVKLKNLQENPTVSEELFGKIVAYTKGYSCKAKEKGTEG